MLRDPLFWQTIFCLLIGLAIYLFLIAPFLPWAEQARENLFDRIYYPIMGVVLAWIIRGPSDRVIVEAAPQAPLVA